MKFKPEIIKIENNDGESDVIKRMNIMEQIRKLNLQK